VQLTLRTFFSSLLDRRQLTDEELEHEAIVTKQDVENAMAAFRRHAPTDARGLLDAEPDLDA
jgi:transcription initiation factor IIE alpha subunit